MKSANSSIKRKIMGVTMLTSIIVLAVAVGAFMTYDLLTFRESMRRAVTTLALVTAENSSGSLAFKSDHDAADVLHSLRLEPQIIKAALYGADGKLFASYPTNLPAAAFPATAPSTGHLFKAGHLHVCQPAFHDNHLQGYLYIESDLRYFYERVKIYAAIAALILFGSLIVALVLANRLQKRISDPIIALSNTARIVSERRDYSVRAPKLSPDELGVLTDAFNDMLARTSSSTPSPAPSLPPSSNPPTTPSSARI